MDYTRKDKKIQVFFSNRSFCAFIQHSVNKTNMKAEEKYGGKRKEQSSRKKNGCQ